jgi:plastocyanin
MKTKITLIFIYLLIGLYLNTAKATIYSIQVANYSFTPNTLNINSGDTVRWVWISGSHTTTSTSVPAGASSWDHAMNSSNTQFDLQLTVAGTYTYECSIHPTMMTGTITVAAAMELTDYTPNSYSVSTYPNPFENDFYFSFSIPENEVIKISVYDITGAKVKTVTDQYYEKGNHIISWDGKNERGEIVFHGLYFYMIEAKNQKIMSGKIIFGS